MICWVSGVVQVVGVGGVVDSLVRDFVEEGPQCVHQPLIQSSMETCRFHLETVQIVSQADFDILLLIRRTLSPAAVEVGLWIPIYNYLYQKIHIEYLSKIQDDRTSHSQL